MDQVENEHDHGSFDLLQLNPGTDVFLRYLKQSIQEVSHLEHHLLVLLCIELPVFTIWLRYFTILFFLFLQSLKQGCLDYGIEVDKVEPSEVLLGRRQLPHSLLEE
jgi:hypothetical protein